MPTTLTKSMKRKMEQVLQESVEVGHISNLEQLE
jgi:hypothetical protein